MISYQEIISIYTMYLEKIYIVEKRRRVVYVITPYLVNS